jgi:hypothetical protein
METSDNGYAEPNTDGEWMVDEDALPAVGGPAIVAKAHANQSSAVEPVVSKVADVVTRPVEWLWESWLPKGSMTILDGDPGLGKSQLVLDVAARVTHGWRMPPKGGDGGRALGSVLILSAEDDLQTTIKPRLLAAGADMDRIFCMSGVRIHGQEEPVVLPVDLDLVESTAVANAVVLIAFDPMVAYFGSRTDSHKDADVRRVLHRVKLLAERTGAAVLCVRHLNKTAGPAAIYRGGGSIGIIGAARAGWIVGKNPDTPGRLILAVSKSNLAPRPRSLEYSIEQSGSVSRIGWIGECDFGPDDIVAKPRGKPGPKGESLAEAEAFLAKALAGGPKATAELYAWARAECVSVGTLRRAKKEIGVISDHIGGEDGGGNWTWRLPDDYPRCASSMNLSILPRNPENKGFCGKALKSKNLSILPLVRVEKNRLAKMRKSHRTGRA